MGIFKSGRTTVCEASFGRPDGAEDCRILPHGDDIADKALWNEFAAKWHSAARLVIIVALVALLLLAILEAVYPIF